MIGVDTNSLIYLELKEMPLHSATHELLRREALDSGEPLALGPQVLAEFIHVATDPRRFQRPLSMAEAIQRATFWWNAREVQRIYPTAESTRLFLEWMARHALGRERLLDTQLAAMLHVAGVRRIMTGNRRDFEIYGVFEILAP